MNETLPYWSGRTFANELDSDLIRLGRVPSPIPRSGENPLFYYKPLVQASLADLLGQIPITPTQHIFDEGYEFIGTLSRFKKDQAKRHFQVYSLVHEKFAKMFRDLTINDLDEYVSVDYGRAQLFDTTLVGIQESKELDEARAKYDRIRNVLRAASEIESGRELAYDPGAHEMMVEFIYKYMLEVDFSNVSSIPKFFLRWQEEKVKTYANEENVKKALLVKRINLASIVFFAKNVEDYYTEELSKFLGKKPRKPLDSLEGIGIAENISLWQRIYLLSQDAFEYDVMYPCGRDSNNK